MKKPKLKLNKLLPGRLRRIKQTESTFEQTGEGKVPLITTETITEHREDVLSSARKYIYPLQHSKHKIVLISSALFITAFISFFVYCTLALYRFKSNTGFLYGVTQVVPFPVAKAGSSFVAYENYLFELRHYTHYYTSQQRLDFKSDAGKQQLAQYKKRALQKVVDDAYVKQLAAKNKISVSDKELNAQIALVRSQNRLGANEKGFEDVLKDNFGWSVGDFKRSLRQEMLAQKVVAALDTGTQNRAATALNELKGGASFADVAKKYSDDPYSKANGGEFGFMVDKTNRDLASQVTDALFKLKPGEQSGIVNTGFGLEIVKNIEVQGDKIKGAHIVFSLKNVNDYLNDLKAKHRQRLFIKP